VSQKGGTYRTVRLGTMLMDIQPGFASGSHNTAGEGIPHFRPMNVTTDGRVDRTVLKFVDPALSRPELRLSRGDVIFNNTNSPELVGKTALFEGDDAPAFSNHMTRLRVNPDELDPGYLALRLHQAWREGWYATHCNNHVSQASIGRDVLRAFEIEVPPIESQRAITSLAGAVDALRSSSATRLASARRSIERFRQAVLAAACSGRLTADWRERELRRAESSKELIERLRAEKPDRKRKIASAALLDGLEVPDSWSVASLDAISTRITSGSRDWSKFYGRGSGTFVMAQNVRPGYLDWTFRQAIDPPASDPSRQRSLIALGDLLVTIVGANTGDVGPVTESRPEHYVCQSVALVRPADPALTQYLNLWFNSQMHGRRYFEQCFYGAGRPHLSFDQLRAAPVALPISLDLS
jgi:type I restriction enzyme, S subunit